MGSNEDKELRVIVNDEVSDVNQVNQAILKIDGQEYVLKSNNHSSNHQKLALRYFLIPAVIGTLIYFLFQFPRAIIYSINGTYFDCECDIADWGDKWSHYFCDCFYRR